MKAIVLSTLLILGFSSAQAQQAVAAEPAQAQQVPLEALVGFTLTGTIEIAETLPGNRGDSCYLKFVKVEGTGATVEVSGFGFSGEFVLSPDGAPSAEIKLSGFHTTNVTRTLELSQAQGGFTYRLKDSDGVTDLLCLAAKPGVY